MKELDVYAPVIVPVYTRCRLYWGTTAVVSKILVDFRTGEFFYVPTVGFTTSEYTYGTGIGLYVGYTVYAKFSMCTPVKSVHTG